MFYRRILCATDFSAASQQALARAVAIATQFGAELLVVHVIEHFPEDLPVDLGAREDEDPQSYLVKAAEEKLSTLLNALGAPQTRRQVLVSQRSARDNIVATVQREKAELLVVGTAVGGLLSHLGSTTSGLLHTVPCDLLVVKAT